MKSGVGRALRWGLALFWVGAVALLTLTPGVGSRPEWERVGFCLICGSRGSADAILNAVMFLPLGLLLGLRWSVGRVWFAGMALSAAIETVQYFLPSRFTNLSDVVWNGAGAALGALAVILLRRWLAERPAPVVARITVLALPALYLFLAGVFLRPVGTEAPYFGQWTARLGHLGHYEGRLVAATVQGRPFPQGPFPDPVEARSLLDRDYQLHATVLKGPPPGRIAPVMSVFDARMQEIFLFGADGEDLVFRQRTLGVASGFDYTEVRFANALAPFAVGDTLRIAAHRRADGVCLVVGDRERCGLSLTTGRTWALLMNLEGASPVFRSFLDVAWMGTLFVLVGLVWGSSTGGAAVAGLAAAGVIVGAAALTPLHPPQALGWLGALAGVVGGAALRPAVRAFLARPPLPGTPGGAARPLS